MRKSLRGVARVDLFEDIAGQVDGRDAPAPLRRHPRARRIVKMLIVGFEKAEVQRVVGGAGWKAIRSEENPIGVADNQPAGGARLAAELAQTSRDVDREVRVGVEETGHPHEVLGAVAGVRADERGAGCAATTASNASSNRDNAGIESPPNHQSG